MFPFNKLSTLVLYIVIIDWENFFLVHVLPSEKMRGKIKTLQLIVTLVLSPWLILLVFVTLIDIAN
jgi:hypothetical protein